MFCDLSFTRLVLVVIFFFLYFFALCKKKKQNKNVRTSFRYRSDVFGRRERKKQTIIIVNTNNAYDRTS